MKRVGHLFDRVVSFENLRRASRLARRGKNGSDGALGFWHDEERELLALQRELREGAYRPRPHRQFWIQDPKRRLISAPALRDQVVQHALCAQIEPVLDRALIHDTYACRRGRGNHRALLRASHHARRYPYVLTGDIRKYFPSVDHAILKALLRRKLKDPQVLWLLDLIVDSGPPQERVLDYFAGDDLFTPLSRPKGLPIGSLTSQIMANFYLSGPDHFVQEDLGCGPYVRYLDDFCLFADEKARLWRCRERIARYLEGLRLKLNENKTLVIATRVGFNFLGFRVRPTHRTLLGKAKRRQRRRLKLLAGLYAAREASLDRVHASVRSILAHDAWGKTYGFRKFMVREFRL